MSERKAINKYYPPDYDPSKVPKLKKAAKKKERITLSAPYSMRCTRCNEYIAERRKFNATKEITNEKYMNIKIIRFHITCPNCNNSISFKTSPQTESLFEPEVGAVRNYEPKKSKVSEDKQESELDVLQRLEKEDIEGRLYQHQQKRRKFDKFWKQNEKLNDGESDIIENLERKLKKQQREQEINNELLELQHKKVQGQNPGLRDEKLRRAQERLEVDGSKHGNNANSDEIIAENSFRQLKRLKSESKEQNCSELSDISQKQFKNIITLKKKINVSSQTKNIIPEPVSNLNLQYSSSEDD